MPLVKSHVAGFVSHAIGDELITLKQAAEPLENGLHYPLFMLCLQCLHKNLGQIWLTDKFAESKINMMTMLPEIDRTKERLADILEDRSLSFLYPMLRVESELWKQVTQAECTPSLLYRWIKDNVDSSLQSSTEFINVLFTCILKQIANDSIKKSVNDSDASVQQSPNTNTDFEKETLVKYQQVLQAFLHDRLNLQLTVLYALQSYCFTLGFPKGKFTFTFIFVSHQIYTFYYRCAFALVCNAL